MSLLTICQAVADLVPVTKPSAIVGSTNDTARLLLACANQAGQALYRRHNWVILTTEHPFNTAASTETYDLPSDFGRLVNETVWDRANYESMRGPLNPQEWQAFKSSILGNTPSTWKKWRIRNISGTEKFAVYPTPDAVEQLVFEYVSDNWCKSSGGTGQAAWAADTDLPVLDDHLMELGILWRFLKRLGMAYDDELAEYNAEVDRAVARDGGSRVLSLTGGGLNPHLLDYTNIPETGYGS